MQFPFGDRVHFRIRMHEYMNNGELVARSRSIVTKNSCAMTHGTRRNVAARDLSGQGGKSKRFARNNRIDSSTPWAAGATEDSLLGENKNLI